MVTTLQKNKILRLGLTVLALLIVGRFSIDEGSIRPLIFLSLFTLTLACVFLVKERIVLFLIIYLALMGLIRRALIPIAGWSSFDPLLILGPSITVIMALSLFWENKSRYALTNEKPDRLMLILFVMGCFQMVNPLSGSPVSGLVASIYIIIPWLWYFIAFYRMNQIDIKHVFNVVEVIGTLIALYGIYQTFYGILPFEQQWVDITGYAALYLAEDMVRAIGSFPSAQEFVFFTMITFMIGFTRMIASKKFILHLPVVLVTLMSIFFASSRTIMFYIALAVVIVSIFSKKTLIGKSLASVISISIVYSIWLSLPQLNPNWFGTAAPAVEHMIEGLVDPLSEDQTGLGHIERFVDGMKSIFTNPVGHGIASVTKAADVSNSTAEMSTEIDISNMIVALGVGGIIYILVIISTIFKTIKVIIFNKTIEYLICLGILIGGFGTWTNGGFYLCSIIIWLLVGWIHKEYSGYRGEDNASSGS